VKARPEISKIDVINMPHEMALGRL